MNTKLLLIGFSSLFILVGCGGGGNNQSSNNRVEALTGVGVDNDATTLDDITTLNNDLNVIFGAADGEPIPVEDNDSVQDVIDRGGS